MRRVTPLATGGHRGALTPSGDAAVVDLGAKEVAAAVSLPPGVLVIRAAGGANCSSVGSVVDMLFAGGVIAGALVVAVTAALTEPVGGRAGAAGGEGRAGEGAEGEGAGSAERETEVRRAPPR